MLVFFFFSRSRSLFCASFSNPDAKLESGLRRRIGCLRAQEQSAWLLLNSRTAEERGKKRRGINGAVWIPGSAGSRTSAGGRASTSTFSTAARRLRLCGSRVSGGFFWSLFLSLFPSFHCVFQRNQNMCSLVILSFRRCAFWIETFSPVFPFYGMGGGGEYFARWHNACSFVVRL